MNANKLPQLVDIINTISVPSIINETDIDELRECIYIIIDEYLIKNIEEYCYKDFNHRIYEYAYEILAGLYDNIEDMIDMPLSELIDEGIYSYFEFYGIKRSETTKITSPKNRNNFSKIIENIKKKDTHEQGTKPWYDFRWRHITASSAYKALGSDAEKNQLILTKCKPISPSKGMGVNITSAMHHGHKFEPLSILLYEEKFDTKVGEFGCIESDKYPHLAASPDGINVKENNPRYGRLLEIKNPTSRKICGIPKKDYWVQMQMQMEVLNLPECDFLETAFKEYESENLFKADGTFDKSQNDEKKGVILCFNDGKKPVYEYTPLGIGNFEDYEKWRDDIIDKHANLTWIKDTYWRMEKWSCVLVRQNESWFNSVKDQFRELWDIILKERESGFEHRKPKKRAKKTKTIQITTPPLNPKPHKLPPLPKLQHTISIDTQIIENTNADF
jgi:putative phage-type endonuclease